MNPPRMDEGHITVKRYISGVEVQLSITPRAAAIIHRGARDEVDLGARLIGEKLGRIVGVGMAWRSTDGSCHQNNLIMV